MVMTVENPMPAPRLSKPGAGGTGSKAVPRNEAGSPQPDHTTCHRSARRSSPSEGACTEAATAPQAGSPEATSTEPAPEAAMATTSAAPAAMAPASAAPAVRSGGRRTS